MANLSCENIYCIYQKAGECILQNVSLDIQGNCIDCIYINIDEDILNKMKENTISNLE